VNFRFQVSVQLELISAWLGGAAEGRSARGGLLTYHNIR